MQMNQSNAPDTFAASVDTKHKASRKVEKETKKWRNNKKKKMKQKKKKRRRRKMKMATGSSPEAPAAIFRDILNEKMENGR